MRSDVAGNEAGVVYHLLTEARGRVELSLWGRALMARALHPLTEELAYTATGKPYLRDSDLRISLSHCPGHVALFVTRELDVGIDVEPIDRPYAHLLPRYFSDIERRRVGEQPAERRAHAAWSLWTAKEACAKALGTGLRFQPPEVGRSGLDGGTAAGCSWWRLEIAPSVVSSVAVKGGGLRGADWVVQQVSVEEAQSYR